MAPCQKDEYMKLMLLMQIFDLTNKQSLITSLLLVLLSVRGFLFVCFVFLFPESKTSIMFFVSYNAIKLHSSFPLKGGTTAHTATEILALHCRLNSSVVFHLLKTQKENSKTTEVCTFKSLC